MANCPHCSEALGSGFVDQATLESRLASKDTSAALLQANVDRLTQEATAHAGSAAALTAMEARAVAAEGQVIEGEQSLALAGSGLQEDIRPHAVGIYQQLPTEERGTLTEWLAGKAKEHPLLAGFFGKAAPPVVVPPVVVPPGERAPLSSTKQTPQQVAEYFASPAFQMLPTAEQKVKSAELQAQIDAQGTAV